VSVIFTLEAPAYFDPIVGEPLEGISALAETIILLRAVEERGHLRRLISLRKVRDRAHELGAHAFDIGAQGITVDADTARAEAILAHLAGQATSPGRPA
jgi:KaiC/GvpD/RAD55 family RecA-like ATPase